MSDCILLFICLNPKQSEDLQVIKNGEESDAKFSVPLLVFSSGKSSRRAELSGEDDVGQVRWLNDLNMRLRDVPVALSENFDFETGF
jgi:hypothetical protein